jgi:hypothetical protein
VNQGSFLGLRPAANPLQSVCYPQWRWRQNFCASGPSYGVIFVPTIMKNLLKLNIGKELFRITVIGPTGLHVAIGELDAVER